RRRLNDYAGAKLTPDQFRPTLEIDAAVALSEITDAAVSELFTLGPFGMGNPAPIFAVLNAESALRPNVIKEKHVRAFLRQNGKTVSATAWQFADRAGELTPGTALDAAIAFENDDFARSQGWGTWSIVLKDIRPA